MRALKIAIDTACHQYSHEISKVLAKLQSF